MRAAVVIPTNAAEVDADPYRARALDYVRSWWAQHHPRLPVHLGEAPPGPWSKGAAAGAGVAEALRAGAQALVIADGDSFTRDPATITRALEALDDGKSWVVPHGPVHRLRQDETDRVLDDPTLRPRLGRVCRPVYEGPAGGGITVLTVDAWQEVDGIDPRFEGWGGEDIAFGYCLEALVHPVHRLGDQLVHLWHPHPAPDLRGSPASEELVARYNAARGYPRRLRAVLDGGEPIPAEPLEHPVRFRIVSNRRALRLSGRNFIRFDRDRRYETTDPDEVDWLRAHPAVAEERTRDTVRHSRRPRDVSPRWGS